MLRHAVRRKVNDLTVAHRLWRTMRASGRQPLAEAVNAYGQALHERERATSKNLIQEVSPPQCGARTVVATPRYQFPMLLVSM